MHGEYKVPGGKLVVADVEVRDGRLADAHQRRLFLEPPEALEAINRGLTGMPADAGELELALAVQSALPSDAEMFGFSAEAVAVTLRRALA